MRASAAQRRLVTWVIRCPTEGLDEPLGPACHLGPPPPSCCTPDASSRCLAADSRLLCPACGPLRGRECLWLAMPGLQSSARCLVPVVARSLRGPLGHQMYVKCMSNGCQVYVEGPLGASGGPLASWVSTQALGSLLGLGGPPNVCQMCVEVMSSVCHRATARPCGASGLLGAHPGSGEPPGFFGAPKCMSNACQIHVKCMSKGLWEPLGGLWPLGCPPRLRGAPRASGGHQNVCQVYVKWMSSACQRASGSLLEASGLLGVHPGSGEPPGFLGTTKGMSNVCQIDVKCMSKGLWERLGGLWPLGCPPRLWGASWVFGGHQLCVKRMSNWCLVYVKGPLGALGGLWPLGCPPRLWGAPRLLGGHQMYVKCMSN
jgi:hypothetical protein